MNLAGCSTRPAATMPASTSTSSTTTTRPVELVPTPTTLSDAQERAAYARSWAAKASRASTTPRRPVASLSSILACIRAGESGGNYHDTLNPKYRGAYQFDAKTWASVGGSGDPAAAPPAEQDQRAATLYARRGIAPWPRRQACAR